MYKYLGIGLNNFKFPNNKRWDEIVQRNAISSVRSYKSNYWISETKRTDIKKHIQTFNMNSTKFSPLTNTSITQLSSNKTHLHFAKCCNSEIVINIMGYFELFTGSFFRLKDDSSKEEKEQITIFPRWFWKFLVND